MISNFDIYWINRDETKANKALDQVLHIEDGEFTRSHVFLHSLIVVSIARLRLPNMLIPKGIELQDLNFYHCEDPAEIQTTLVDSYLRFESFGKLLLINGFICCYCKTNTQPEGGGKNNVVDLFSGRQPAKGSNQIA